jgi:hypothetical protein
MTVSEFIEILQKEDPSLEIGVNVRGETLDIDDVYQLNADTLGLFCLEE